MSITFGPPRVITGTIYFANIKWAGLPTKTLLIYRFQRFSLFPCKISLLRFHTPHEDHLYNDWGNAMLEMLKGLTRLAGSDVIIMDELREKYPIRFTETGAMDYKWFEETIRPNNHIYIRLDKNSIAFTLKKDDQKGCELRALIGAVIELVYAQEQVFVGYNDEMHLKLKDKSKQATNNLLLAFKHLKELERLRTVCEDLKKADAIQTSNVTPKEHDGPNGTRNEETPGGS